VPDRKKQNGPIIPEAVCPKCGLVHGVGELCTRFALNLAFDGSEAQAAPTPVPASPATEPGQVSPRGHFHHYRIACHPDGMLWELGSGAMGITYKAYDERLKLDVALKVINQTFMNDRGAQTLFLREARAAARVRHSNVASVLFLNDAPGNVFYAMEFVAGEPLNAWLKHEGKIVPLVAIDVAKQLASGLGAIHAEGLIHRDLKPANILLQPAVSTATTADGTSFAHRSAMRVKIIDFGVAREIATEVDAVSTIGFRGTVAYASPEQCEEHYDLDGRSDLYSLGCILFEMLAGHPPFAARSRRAFLNLHVTEPPPLHLLDDQPAILVAVIARLLAKNPEERYTDAQALVEALDGAEEKIERLGPVATAGGKRGSPLKIVSKWFSRLGKKIRGQATSRHALPAPGQKRPKSRAWMLWLLAVATASATAVYFRQRPTSAMPLPAGTIAKPVTNEARVPILPGAKRSLAVLPFVNASGDKENSFFADGLRDDVLAQLARIRGLKVISRISAEQYMTGDRVDLKKLAQDLGVDTVLDVTIRNAGNGMRAAVQLVDPVTSENIWVANFDCDAKNVFAVQSQIALNVAEQLNVDLVASEKSSMMRPPTGSAAAYQLYLKGRALVSDSAETEKNWDDAVTAFNSAITADPNFAMAHAQLSALHTNYFLAGRDHTDHRLELALKSAEAARRLQPDLPEAQVAMGNYYYRGFKDYASALPYFQNALSTMPGNIDALIAAAAIERRQGRWAEAAGQFEQALEMTPTDPILRYNLAATYVYMRQYERAMQVLEPALKANPNDPVLNRLKGKLFAAWKGDLGPMRHDVEVRPPNVPSPDFAIYFRIELLLLERRFDDALATLRASNFALADGEAVYFTRDMLQAEILTQAGRQLEARQAWEKALPRLTQAAASRPNDARLRLALALVLAGTGDNDRALQEAKAATELVPVEKDAFDAPYYLHGLALVEARTGKIEEAKALMERLSTMPSMYSKALFLLSPAWNSVRN
jgi:serine/threonine protein kinase/TolB-like protein/predicted Zn-dependent protease